MTHTLNPLPRAVAAALGCVASVAMAQVPPASLIYSMVSPSLPWANEFSCTVTNVSGQTVTLSMLQIVANGGIRANLNASCLGTLEAGQRCTVRTDAYLYRGSVVPHCRAKFSGQEAALVGSLSSSYTYGGTAYDIAVVPLQLVKGITLAPAWPALPAVD